MRLRKTVLAIGVFSTMVLFGASDVSWAQAEEAPAAGAGSTETGAAQTTGPDIDMPTEAPDVSLVGDSGEGRTGLGGYGEFHFGRSMPESGDAENEVDFHRMVIFLGKRFNKALRFYAEIEIEHAIAAAGQPGEVALEQAFVEYQLADEKSAIGEFGVRAGIVLVPFGITNQNHEPPTFHGVERARVASIVIPTTWREGGAGIYGTVGPLPDLSYEAYVVGGLNPLGFSSSKGLRGGRQKVGEARANGLAVAGRLAYRLGMSTTIGLAGYAGNAGPNAGTVYDDLGNEMTLKTMVKGFAVDAMTKLAGFEARAVFAMFGISNTDSLANIYDADGTAIGKSVGDRVLGAYGEVAYDVLHMNKTSQQLMPFARIEYYETNPDDMTNAGTDVVLGLSYRPIRQVAFKGDFTIRNARGGAPGENLLNLGVGFLY